MTAFVGPWGTTYASNLTPDRATGIGTWLEADFIKALRTGKHLGATRPILPPMPWQSIGTLPDKDLRAIYAYLMAQPAVKNKVPEYAPPVVPVGKVGGAERRGGLEGAEKKNAGVVRRHSLSELTGSYLVKAIIQYRRE